jgi:uncharacterized protein YdiU (UPF0061 family)
MPSAIDAAGWRFDNSYTRLPPGLFTRSTPVPVQRPGLAFLNAPLATALGLEAVGLAGPDAAAIFAGNAIPPGADPIAQAYAGHQYGHFTNLGDGRAILLGEQIAPDGSRHDIQLKGSGRTRYSRGGDGRAALGPMLREVLISEAMHALGIPTTRSLAVASTGEAVLREEALPGAVLVRVAASHIRVGTFQYAAAVGDPTLLPALLAHTIRRHDPHLADAEEPALAFLEAVIDRQAALIARWLQVGFVHGVMNTDNMAVSGETIDYGPCAFLDAYDPTTVFSSIDRQGRYAWANQPGIAHWNLARLAESLLPTIPGDAEAALNQISTVLATFPARFAEHALAGWRAKLGLLTEEDGDQALATALLAAMEGIGADFTATFSSLAAAAEAPVATPPFDAGPLADWRTAWRARLDRQPQPVADAAALLRRTNPLVIPRNHRVEEALAAAVAGEMAPFEKLLDAVTHPFDDTPANRPYRDGPPFGCAPYKTFCGT